MGELKNIKIADIKLLCVNLNIVSYVLYPVWASKLK